MGEDYKPRHLKDEGGDETDRKITIPVTYPNDRFKKTNVAMPSDLNVEYAKEWVDFNQK